MKVYVVSLMHNEADIVEQTIDHYIKQKVDGFIISDILSTDGTKEILSNKKNWCRKNGIKFTLIHEPQFGYFQAIKFNAMARMAAGFCYPEKVRIIPIDCDEFWIYGDGKTKLLGDFLRETKIEFFWSGMKNMISTSLDDKSEMDPIKRIQYHWCASDKRNEKSNVKTIFTYYTNVWLELGAHRTRYMEYETTMFDGGLRGSHVHHINDESLIIRHYPARSEKQFIQKSRANAKSVTVAGMENSGANYHSVERGKKTDEELKAIFYKTYYSKDPIKERCIKCHFQLMENQ